MKAAHQIALAGALVAMLAIGFVAGRASMPDAPAAPALVSWNGEMITPKDAALRRIGDPTIAAEMMEGLYRDTENPMYLIDYERLLRMADDAAADARKLGATENEIARAKTDVHWVTPHGGPLELPPPAP